MACSDTMVDTLDDERLARCFERGKRLDLSHCVYGDAHWEGAFSDVVEGYYHFLAGLVRELSLTTLAELGTHYGGSTQAMLAGIPDDARARSRMVTVDVTRLNRAALEAHSNLRCIQGDSLSPRVVSQFVSAFDRHVDLLFVDTIHTFDQTLENTAVYANRLKPRFLILDDIRLNADMRRLWSYVAGSGAGIAHDLSDLVERPRAGFGLVECRYPFHWPESSPRARALKRALWSTRLRVSGALPESAKATLRRALRR